RRIDADEKCAGLRIRKRDIFDANRIGFAIVLKASCSSVSHGTIFFVPLPSLAADQATHERDSLLMLCLRFASACGAMQLRSEPLSFEPIVQRSNAPFSKFAFKTALPTQS